MIESRFSSTLAAVLVCAGLGFAKLAVAQDAAAPANDDAAKKLEGNVAKCAACHGPTGTSVNPEWPSIAGQNAVYIHEQLSMIKSKHRNNPIMQPIVADMTEQEFAALAEFFAKQTPSGLEADPSYWKAGEALYKSGDPARNIPACTACHGPAGQGNPASGYPALRAQHSVYTVKQLQDYLTQNRYRDPANPATVHTTRNSAMMTTIAGRLSPEDIRNVASYLQGLR